MRLFRFFCFCILVALAACGGGSGNSVITSLGGPSSFVITGRVIDINNQPVPGVTVNVGTSPVETDASGLYSVTLPGSSINDQLALLSFKKQGYTLQMQRTASPVTQSLQLPDAVVRAVAFTSTFNSATAQTLQVSGSSAAVILPADALRTGAGIAPSGAITAAVTPIDASTTPALMPGSMGESDVRRIESFGAMQVDFTDASGQKLNLAAGQTASLRIPAAGRGTLPATIPLYYLDESTGYWIQQGSAMLAGTAPNQYYEGVVSHFSVWNSDQVYDSVVVKGCLRDSVGAIVTHGRITGAGVDYVGALISVADENGNFTIRVKRSTTSRITGQTISPSTNYSDPQDVTVGNDDVILPNCLVNKTDGIAPLLQFPSAATISPPTPAAPPAATTEIYAGSYSGNYSGNETGTFNVVINSSGVVTGSGVSNTYRINFLVSGSASNSGVLSLNAASGTAGASQFSGSIDAATGAVSGSWRYTNASGGGPFSGTRR